MKRRQKKIKRIEREIFPDVDVGGGGAILDDDESSITSGSG